MQVNSALTVPFFKTMPVQDQNASKREGRPIFKDMEVVEVRIAGDRNYTPTFPANAMWQRIDGQEVTYAERWPDAYERFTAGKEQIAEGTPLSELPFLSEAKRAELRALKVYTAEALASLDGKNLKALGDTGREMKNQATAYLESAGSTAGTVALAAEVAALKAQIAEMGDAAAFPPAISKSETGQTDDQGDDAEKESIKAQIAELTGSRPKGNPSLDTLREMLSEMTARA